jgi:hypothetical protein
MKLRKREELRANLWINENLILNEDAEIFAEIEENEIFVLIKNESNQVKLKISKYENSEKNEQQPDGIQES